MLHLRHTALYKQVYTDYVLTEAWRRVRTGTDQAGVDGVTIASFQARLFANLKTLQTTLRQQRYQPQPVKHISIPKNDGTRRPLGILAVSDRIVQRAVLAVIEPLFEVGFEECSHGFRKERSVHTALDQVVRLINLGHGWVVDLDIAECFDRINTAQLFTFIKAQLKDPELRRLIAAWLAAETVTVERPGFWRRQEARGILQGGILSPLFANIYLDRFDKMLLKQGLKHVRYADDCIVCCRSKAEAEVALGLVEKCLARLDLAVNPRKTTIYHAERGLHYLGERLMLKKRGPYEELVHVPRARRVQDTPALPTPLALPPGATTSSVQEDTWVPSTSPNKEP